VTVSFARFLSHLVVVLCVVCVVVVVFRLLGNIISCSYIFLYDMTFIFKKNHVCWLPGQWARTHAWSRTRCLEPAHQLNRPHTVTLTFPLSVVCTTRIEREEEDFQ
jgi:hypothetical protein